MIRKKKEGQALIEFVIILPVLIFMIFAVIDFGKVLYTKNNLENKMEDVITLHESGMDLNAIQNDLKLEKEKIELQSFVEDEYLNFTLEKKVEIITPGLNLILGSPHHAVVKRVVLNE